MAESTNPPLELPEHFDPSHAADWSYEPDPTALRAAARALADERSGAAESSGAARVSLLLIDVQRDFCMPDGSLFVAGRSGRGAVDDSVRICEFIYRNLRALSEVVCTLDTHYPQQIFFASFWQHADGSEVDAGREVTAEQLERGDLEPRPELADWLCGGDREWLRAQVLDYCRRLEAEGRYQLFLWPEHCLLGSTGHTLVGVVQEARLFHSYVKGARAPLVTKGSDALTESYSVFRSEVREAHDGTCLGQFNRELLQQLLRRDLLVVAGQAASHCVRASVDDLLAEIERTEPSAARKIVLLEDCMSSVVLRDPTDAERVVVDFSPQAEEALERYRQAGMRISRSDRLVQEWL